MSSLRRAFLAIVPPADVLDAIEVAVAPLRRVAPPGLRWSRRAQWHLTLQFLGAVDDVDELTDSVVGNLHGRTPVRLGVGGAGAFPSVSRASVLWIGLDDGHDALASLVGVVERATEPLGVEPDFRPFHAHLTIARSSRARPWARWSRRSATARSGRRGTRAKCCSWSPTPARPAPYTARSRISRSADEGVWARRGKGTECSS